MSGEDQRHSYHEEQEEQVLSRTVLGDGRIVETTTTDHAANPPNVIRGNNAGL